jgi:hypothetical protein
MAIQDKSTPNGYTHAGKTTLVARGWTESLIKKHLPEPDKYLDNQHHRSGPKRAVWSWTTIFEAEAKITNLLEKTLAKRSEYKKSDAAYYREAAKVCRYKRDVHF